MDKLSRITRVMRHVRKYRAKYYGLLLFAFIVLVVVHKAENGGPLGTLVVYKILECLGDVTIDRLFPGTFLSTVADAEETNEA